MTVLGERAAPGEWRRVPLNLPPEMQAQVRRFMPGMRCYQRDVDDGGHLMVLFSREIRASKDGPLWHLSISHRTNTSPPMPGRYPTWDEIRDARDRFLPADLTFAMYLPPAAEYVNAHETCFHLWEAPPDPGTHLSAGR